jgi:aminoglycoside phosphotransferase (APT) family kinase protein
MPAHPLNPDQVSELRSRIGLALAAATGGAVQVPQLEPLAGGACQDLFKVELRLDTGPLAGTQRMVLRSDARRSLPGSIARRIEYEVMRVAAARGVPTPAPHWLCRDLLRPGADAYFMPWLAGEAIGRRVTKSPELAAARVALPGQLAGALARIHAIEGGELAGVLAPPAGSPAEAAIAAVRAQLDGMPEPHPALELALRWLASHAPACPAVTLVHGDFRTGNFLVGPEGLAGVLDWEFAHLGDPMEDLGWLCVRDWRFGQLALPVGGLAPRRPFHDAYTRASGRAVDPKAVHWWEVMGNVKWACGSVYQGERYLSGEERDLELVAIARRACEMEWEALRLIEAGPKGS